MKTWLGLDVGSVSVKLAIVDESENLVRSVYLRNCGLIETVQKGLKAIGEPSEIAGVGVTGSGRRFVGMLVGADLVKTEILAHTVGTLSWYPEVRTLMDIGGEDSKLMTLNNGVLENFQLNSICSAGTGSFLESIAGRMGIRIEDVGDIALRSRQRLDFPSKCGVFTQSAVVSKKNAGASKEDILMGVCRSLVANYLTMAKGARLEPPFVFQGATAKNKALVAAFEEELGHPVIVPEYCDVMGAIGIAIMVKRADPSQTNFKGCRLLNRKYETKTVIANGCENHCELNLLFENGQYVGCIGNKCGKCGAAVPVKRGSHRENNYIRETFLTRKDTHESETKNVHNLPDRVHADHALNGAQYPYRLRRKRGHQADPGISGCIPYDLSFDGFLDRAAGYK